MQGAPKVCTHATDAEPLAAIPHDEEHDHAAPDNSGFTSFKAPKEAEDGGVAKDLGVKKADELDSIVAEVQETADLVSSLSMAIK